jgi:NitT/TauT family transport system permease protein
LGGIAIAEYWPKISGSHNLVVSEGLMKIITSNTASGNIGVAAWTSLLFAIAVIIFGLVFTKKLLDLASKKYVVEDGIYQA